jgi:hypothetical protein
LKPTAINFKTERSEYISTANRYLQQIMKNRSTDESQNNFDNNNIESMFVCVCVCERERERKKEIERERERKLVC